MSALRLVRQHACGARVDRRGRFPVAGNILDLDFDRRYGTFADNRRFLNRTIFTRAKRVD